MRDLKALMKDHYLRYASYVILDRAIPDIADGLKPVQRRILHTLFKMHDGKFHKVANVCGQTMAYHPHGDAPIYEALVTLAQKGYLLSTQGNFGNIYTGDSAAAARYIETRLSSFAQETMFNPKLTEYVPSYDGRNLEPVALPAKVPLLLMQGAEGIAVGMATHIFPHNFCELIEAQMAYLKGQKVEVYPDFATGGIMDVSQYDDGRGKIRLRAKIEVKDQKTLVIRQIAPSTTTESVMQSIDEAVRKGKIKIDSIHDYTAEEVEIAITLPRGVYADDMIDKLYALTQCEVSLTSGLLLIKDNMPVEMTVSEVIAYYVDRLKWCLQKELEIERQEVARKWFLRSLEAIFIEEKLYKELEELVKYEQVYEVLQKAFVPFKEELKNTPSKEDIEYLLAIPIRRIARFDREQNEKDRKECIKRLGQIDTLLKDISKYALGYLEGLLVKYKDSFPRKTVIDNLTVVDKRKAQEKQVDIFVDRKTGFVGLKVNSSDKMSCSNLDRLIVMYSDGVYKVIPVDDRIYVGRDVPIEGVFVAKKDELVFSCIYKEKETGFAFIKRFSIQQFILEKEYRYFDEGCKLLLLTTKSCKPLLQLVPKPKQKLAAIEVDTESYRIKGVTAGGVRLSPRPVLGLRMKG